MLTNGAAGAGGPTRGDAPDAKPLYIFDIDGTLADVEHRLHLLQGRAPDRWRRFFAASVHDTPVAAVITTLLALRRGETDIQIWSGRSDEVRAETVAWLALHTAIAPDEIDGMLRMRREQDYTQDDVLKARWLDDLSDDDRARLVGVFEDRDRVVAMWRARGVTCFQVAGGDF